MWDERYSDEDYVYGKNPNEFLANAVDKIPKGKVLCIAEGEGMTETRSPAPHPISITFCACLKVIKSFYGQDVR